MKAHNPLRILLVVTAVSLISTMAFAPSTSPTLAILKRIQFTRGATSAVVSGNLPANTSARYILRALAGQLIDVTLSAPDGTRVRVTTSGGRVLTPIAGTSSSTGFRGYLPFTGDYIVAVASGSQGVSYSVNVSIPVRVAFNRGATADTLKGHLDAHQGLDYILRAREGQILEIDTTPDPADVPLQLIIYGVDGSVLKSGMGEESSFRGELPVSEDYIVSVRAGEQAADFKMNVIIPQRIRFQTGAVSASVFGFLLANRTHYYSVSAMENQTLQVKITPRNSLQLIIYGADGTVLKSDMSEGDSFSGMLPNTQDYILEVRSATTRIGYRLHVTIK